MVTQHFAVYNLRNQNKQNLVDSIRLNNKILRSRARMLVFGYIEGFRFMEDSVRPPTELKKTLNFKNISMTEFRV